MPVAPKGARVWPYKSRWCKLIDAGLIESVLVDPGTDSFARAGALASFGRSARLLKPAQFEQVFAENERARTDTLLVMARPNALGHARLGMVIAKRLLPRAVDRNRIKRCVRETFRLQRKNLPACDFVVRLLGRPTAGAETPDLARTFSRAAQRATQKWPVIPTTE